MAFVKDINKDVILKAEKLCKSFSTGGNQQHVLRNLDLEIYRGDFTVLMGCSGSGKSTLLYALSGMDKPSMGKVIFKKQVISQLGSDELAVFRRKNCGFVFQSMYLLEDMDLVDNILTSALLVDKNKRKKKETVEEIKSLLKQVGLTKEDFNKFPPQLSGGEAQRVGIVRALINKPQVIFADEPTGALNSAAGKEVLDIFSKVNEEGQSIVMVTHDIKTALRGNRILYMKDGVICGEQTLGTYTGENLGERRNKLQAFLEEMGW